MALKLGLVIFSIAVHVQQVITERTSEEQDICDQCTTKVENSFVSMRELMQNKDKIEVKLPPPCKLCTVYGASNVKLVGEVCPKQVPDKEGKTFYDHPMTFNYNVMNITCICNLPCNPVDVVKLAVKQSQNPLEGFECSEGGAPSLDPMLITKNFVPMNPVTLMQNPECGKGGLPMGLNSPKETEGYVLMDMTNFQLKLELRSSDADSEIDVLDINAEDSGAWKLETRCESKEDKNFEQACNCLLATGFMKQLIVTIGASMIPCMGKDKISERQDIMKEIMCNDVFEQ